MTQERDQTGAELSAADEQVLRELTERARVGALNLTGEGGLLGRLAKMAIEGALEGELDVHLGYAKYGPEGRDGGNSRNGHPVKTVITDTGPVELSVPRDRDSSFEPKIVAKRQRQLTGVDDTVISLSVKGLTHGEIAARGQVPAAGPDRDQEPLRAIHVHAGLRRAERQAVLVRWIPARRGISVEEHAFPTVRWRSCRK